MRRESLLHRHDFDVHQIAYLVLGQKKPVNGIERLRVEVFLASLAADLRHDVLDDVELALKPVLLLHDLLFRIAAAKLARDSGFHAPLTGSPRTHQR